MVLQRNQRGNRARVSQESFPGTLQDAAFAADLETGEESSWDC
jgi:hypothetical protein